MVVGPLVAAVSLAAVLAISDAVEGRTAAADGAPIGWAARPIRVSSDGPRTGRLAPVPELPPMAPPSAQRGLRRGSSTARSPLASTAGGPEVPSRPSRAAPAAPTAAAPATRQDVRPAPAKRPAAAQSFDTTG